MNYLNCRGLTGINSKPMRTEAQIHTLYEGSNILLGITSKIRSSLKVGGYVAVWIEWCGNKQGPNRGLARANYQEKGAHTTSAPFH